MTNTNIADDLIYGQQNIGDSSSQTVTPAEKIEVTRRVVSTKTKFYVVLFLGLGLLLFYQFVIPAYDTNVASKNALAKVQSEVDAFQEKKAKAESVLASLRLMEDEEEGIVSCVNQGR